MKKWKKYGAFMFAMVMCLSLAACGSSDSIAASSEETENADKMAQLVDTLMEKTHLNKQEIQEVLND